MQQRQRCLPDGSSVKREFQALFCEKPEVQSLRLTLPICARLHHSGDLCQSCQFATHRYFGFGCPAVAQLNMRHTDMPSMDVGAMPNP